MGEAQQELTTTLGPAEKLSSGETYPLWTESYRPVSWLDTTHLALEGVRVLRSQGGPSRETIYLLDTSKGAGQHASDLQTVFASTLFYGSLTGGSLTTATQLNPLSGAFVGWAEI